MAQPFRNPYLTWLETLSSPQADYQKSLQQWQQAVADAWQAPSAYWQTIGAIMGSRAQSLQTAASRTPAHLHSLAACTTWPQWVGAAMAWNGELIAQSIRLATTTQAQRMGLLNQWQYLAQRNFQQPTQRQQQPSANAPTPAFVVTAPAPARTPVQQPAPAKPQQASATPAPQPATTASAPAQTAPVQKTQASTPTQPTSSTQQQAPQPAVAQRPQYVLTQTQPAAQTRTLEPAPQRQEYALLNGTTGQGGAPSPAALVSPTANSVMRSSAGATISSAAAAARRSVVARRQARRRPR